MVLLFPAPDLGVRLLVAKVRDHWKVNSVAKPAYSRLLHVKDCVDRVGTACYVTKLDFLEGYLECSLKVSPFYTACSRGDWCASTFCMKVPTTI